MSPSRHQIGLFPENPEADGCDMFLGWVLCKHHVGRPESETAGTGPAPPHPARTATRQPVSPHVPDSCRSLLQARFSALL